MKVETIRRFLKLTAAVVIWVLFTHAAPGQAPVVRPEDAHAGALLLKTASPGVYLPAPVLDTDVSIRVTGMIARTTVSQRFRNGTGSCVEGIYVFPLPEGSAVDAMRLVIGDRVIEGQVKEREEAKKAYEQAKSEGRKASLVEQERPNIFTTSVASIGPDEEVQVVLEYQEALRFNQGAFRLRFPMVVAPRYNPAPRPTGDEQSPSFVQAAASSPATVSAGVPDAVRIRPPVADPAAGFTNPHLKVSLDPGFPLRRVESATHALRTDAGQGNHTLVTLADRTVAADRDFELAWEPDLGQEPKASVFTQTVGGQLYSLLMVIPPDAAAPETRLPRETVFVIDTSGSMHGTSIDGARQALSMALSRLAPEDRFNVIEFNSVTRRLFPESRRALPAAVEQARRWVGRLEAQGGTEMLPALAAALESSGEESSSGSVRQVLFMTDGAVGNEEELFAFIEKHLGKSRLFTVGLGSAPNSHFMTRAAMFGRGTFTYVASAAEVQPKMTALFRKLEAPVLTNLEVRWDDVAAEAWPSKVPDLYAGEPLVVAVRLASASSAVTVSGERGGRPWSQRLTLSASREDSGVARLWARFKIAALMDSATAGAEADKIRRRVVEVALAHHLVSSYTSLVAVDVTPGSARGAACEARPLPVQMPDGWSAEHVFGEMPSTATPGRVLLLLGFALLSLSAAVRIAGALR
ncbi:MAG: marine proteobacterial sortase target protein [Acidobacteriota bacterium]|nr:marine proteobacterial sortase target protein [Acidobacteriota bacterium]